MSHRYDRRSRKLRVERLEERAMLSSQPTLIDINLAAGSLSSNPGLFANVNGVLFFSAVSEQLGRELWKTDGTTAGTTLVRDIRPGMYYDSNPWDLINVNGRLFFLANDGTSGYELWTSDGSESGTRRVTDINPGAANSVDQGELVQNHAIIGDTLYFVAKDGSSGKELWKSDGTAQGTVRVRDIKPGNAGSDAIALTALDGHVYFSADDAVNGRELWRSDGTELGTYMVKDINGPGQFRSSDIQNVSVVNGKLFFVASAPDPNPQFGNRELWVSDGTAHGTVKFRESDPAVSTAMRLDASGFTNVNGVVIFAASDNSSSTANPGLWVTDGTLSGTSRIAEFPYGSEFPRHLTAVGNLAFFVKDAAIWRSDGSALGTFSVSTGKGGSLSRDPGLVNLGGTAYFRYWDQYFGEELWKSDGTIAGTKRVKELRLGDNPTDVGSILPVGNQLYFSATDPRRGRELWKSDGTEAETLMVADIQRGTASSDPIEFTNVGGILYFTATDGVHGRELWRISSPGSAASLVKDILPGPAGSSPSSLFNHHGVLYFSANDGVTGWELWKSDGTVAGTIRVKDIVSGSGSSSTSRFTQVGNTLFFRSTGFAALWRTDGTEAGTVQVSPNGLSSVDNLTNVGGILYFSGSSAFTGNELWKSDGTTAGTIAIRPSSGSNSFPRSFVNANGTLYYVANRTSNDPALWMTDGTVAGTVLVQPSVSGQVGISPEKLFVFADTVLYSAVSSDGKGRELWKVIPTVKRTALIKDINPGTFHSYPGDFVNVSGTVYFRARSNEFGSELWKTDGTEEGTVQVKDIAQGSSWSYPTSLTNANGLLAFSATNSRQGQRLWLSNGTQTGTVQLGDVLQGGVSGNPKFLTNVDDRLYFSAGQALTGTEVWVVSAELPLIGDYDRNGIVVQSDHAFWIEQFARFKPLTYYQADGNSDGIVDAADYTVWRDALPTPAATTSTVAIASAAVSVIAPQPIAASPVRRLGHAVAQREELPPLNREAHAAQLLLAREAAFAQLGAQWVAEETQADSNVVRERAPQRGVKSAGVKSLRDADFLLTHQKNG